MGVKAIEAAIKRETQHTTIKSWKASKVDAQDAHGES
jgi:hypothetical protein